MLQSRYRGAGLGRRVEDRVLQHIMHTMSSLVERSFLLVGPTKGNTAQHGAVRWRQPVRRIVFGDHFGDHFILANDITATPYQHKANLGMKQAARVP